MADTDDLDSVKSFLQDHGVLIVSLLAAYFGLLLILVAFNFICECKRCCKTPATATTSPESSGARKYKRLQRNIEL